LTLADEDVMYYYLISRY